MKAKSEQMKLKPILITIIVIILVSGLYFYFKPTYKPLSIVKGKPNDTLQIPNPPVTGKKEIKPKKVDNKIIFKDTIQTQKGKIYIESPDVENIGLIASWMFQDTTKKITEYQTEQQEVKEPFYKNGWFYLSVVWLGLLVLSLFALIK